MKEEKPRGPDIQLGNTTDSKINKSTREKDIANYEQLRSQRPLKPPPSRPR